MGMCSRLSGMCTWALYSSEVKTLTSLGRGHWWPHKTRCNHSNRAYCQRKSLRMHVGFMALEENFKSISRKVIIIETPIYCEKETGGHSVKKGCSGHVGNVGRRKGRSVVFSTWTSFTKSGGCLYITVTETFKGILSLPKEIVVEETELQWFTKKCEECSAGAIKSVDFCVICLSCSVGNFNMSTVGRGIFCVKILGSQWVTCSA